VTVTPVRVETFVTARTARVAMLGPESGEVKELWYALHGYSELAPAFLDRLRAIDDGTRLIVAPEALSRFYEGRIEDRGGNPDAPVGASWMTREARELEIADYLAYLDGVHAMVRQRLAGSVPAGTAALTPAVTVLGFSQGGSTGARWVASGSVSAARHVLWGSSMPPEIDLVTAGTPIRAAETGGGEGARDIYATPKVVARENGRLDAAGFPYRFVSFDGGHRLDDDVLRAIAGMTEPGDATGA